MVDIDKYASWHYTILAWTNLIPLFILSDIQLSLGRGLGKRLPLRWGSFLFRWSSTVPVCYKTPRREVNTMTIIQKLRASLVIRQVAKQHRISTSQCRSDIQDAITAAWATSDPEAKHRQIELVGEERIPTPEEFIVLVARRLQPGSP